jgi:hypothetical protein
MQLGRMLITVGALVLPSVAMANENITYTYDVFGRLTQISHSGTVNNGMQTSYLLDNADNRIKTTITGAPYSVIVIPLNGISLIPIIRR